MRTKFKNLCSCGRYETAYDFDSVDIARKAAEMHVCLLGYHEVTCFSKVGNHINPQFVIDSDQHNDADVNSGDYDYLNRD